MTHDPKEGEIWVFSRRVWVAPERVEDDAEYQTYLECADDQRNYKWVETTGLICTILNSFCSLVTGFSKEKYAGMVHINLGTVGGDPNTRFDRKVETVDDLPDEAREYLESLSNYGKPLEIIRDIGPPVNQRINVGLANLLNKDVYPSHVSNSLTLYGMSPSNKFKGKLKLYKTSKDRERDRETAMKPGKAIRWVFPELTDVQIADIVREFNNKFADKDYTVHTGRSRAHFKHMYTKDRAPNGDPTCTTSRKGLMYSCMHGLSVGGISPAEVYGSGEFTAVWVEDEEGRIAGRVVVWDGGSNGPVSGPMYGVDDQTFALLEGHLAGMKCKVEAGEGSWHGAKLLLLQEGNDIIAPYSDMEQDCEDDGEYLTITNYGEYEMSRTDGYLVEGGCLCSHCEEHHFDSDYEGIYVEGVGSVGPCCEGEYIFSDYRQEFVSSEDVVEVNYRYRRISTGGSRTLSELEVPEADDVVYCEAVGEFWRDGYVTYSEHMDEYVPTHLIEDYPEYFPSEDEDEDDVCAA